MEANGRFDLLRSKPLNGDLQTRSAKRKGVATDQISEQDSHRHDTVLLTSFKRSNLRRNLNADQFSAVDETPTPPTSSQTEVPSSSYSNTEVPLGHYAHSKVPLRGDGSTQVPVTIDANIHVPSSSYSNRQVPRTDFLHREDPSGVDGNTQPPRDVPANIQNPVRVEDDDIGFRRGRLEDDDIRVGRGPILVELCDSESLEDPQVPPVRQYTRAPETPVGHPQVVREEFRERCLEFQVPSGSW